MAALFDVEVIGPIFAMIVAIGGLLFCNHAKMKAELGRHRFHEANIKPINAEFKEMNTTTIATTTEIKKLEALLGPKELDKISAKVGKLEQNLENLEDRIGRLG